MMSPEEKAKHAYEEGAIADLLMGRWPYFEPAAYMAPSNVPTNWEKILRGLDQISELHPDVPAQLTAARESMTKSAESAYCALEVVLHYLDGRSSFSQDFLVDWEKVVEAVRKNLASIEAEARGAHFDWMGPTSETLLERLNVIRRVLSVAHGITL